MLFDLKNMLVQLNLVKTTQHSAKHT